MNRVAVIALALLAGACGSEAGTGRPADPGFTPGRHVVAFDVGGVQRTAVVVVPVDRSKPLPVVFVFHGHGGSGAGIERTINIERLWPEAVAVYPDGLAGHKGITDTEGVKPGWQTAPGESGDRDLAFYDTMLARLRSTLPADGTRLYAMGHSNGSAFATLLLSVRGDGLAATAHSSAAPSPALLAAAPARSMFISIGERDRVVPADRQKLNLLAAAEKVGVDPAATQLVDGYFRSASGQDGLELATYVHPGGHDVPPELPALVVEFFQRHTRPA